jgi:polygalacturonase
METKIIFIACLVFGALCINTFNIRSYGALGDGRTKDTLSVRKAVQDLSEKCQHACILLFPAPGTYLTGPFNLTSNLILDIQKGATILASDNEEDYPPLPALPSYGRSRDVGTPKEHHQFIGGWNLQNIEIRGGGLINGNGELWWKKKQGRQLKHGRPRLISIWFSKNILIHNIKIVNTPFWAVHPYASDNVSIHHIEINSPMVSPNTDGINPDSCTNVHISYCKITCGDDQIAIKSGWDEAGLRFNRPSENITVTDCEFGSGGGIAIGSEMSGGIRNILIKDTTMVTSAKGLVIKTSRGRGNVVENIRFQNITMRSTLLYGIYLNMFYQRRPPVEPRLTPKFRNIVFHQISGTGINAGQFLCLPESPCEGIHLVDVKMESLIGWKCENAGGSTRNVFPDPCIRNSTGSLTK